jgi:hypothetical protein
VIATLLMDVLTGATYALRLTRPLPPNLIGRWFGSIAAGRPVHTDIARATTFAHEMAIALPVHYAIGVTLTLTYLLVTAALGVVSARFAPAMTFGLATSLLPWLLMFPAMGYGFFGAHGPQGTRLFTSSAISHACFGLGLWLSSLLLIR